MKVRKRRTALGRQKDKLRGLIGTANQGYDAAQREVFGRATRGFLKILLSAREAISQHNYEQYLDWAESTIRSQLPSLKFSFGQIDTLRYIFKAKDIGVEKELIWISHRLSKYANEISVFVSLKALLEREIFSSGNEVEPIIDVIEETFGDSIWLLELKVAIYQLLYGFERQKKFVEEIKSQVGPGVLSYIVHHASIRCEPSISLTGYWEQQRVRLKKAKKIDTHKNYLLYKLRMPDGFNKDAISEILRIEQSHALIDVYETFIWALEYLDVEASEEKALVSDSLLLSVIDKVSEIDDKRLKRLKRSVETRLGMGGDIRKEEVSREAILKGEADSTTVDHGENEDLLSKIMDLGFARFEGDELGDDVKDPAYKIVDLLGAVSRRNSYQHAFAELQKVLVSLDAFESSRFFLNIISSDKDRGWRGTEKNWHVFFRDVSDEFLTKVGIKHFGLDVEDRSILVSCLEGMISAKRERGPFYKDWLDAKNLFLQKGDISDQKFDSIFGYESNSSKPSFIRSLIIDRVISLPNSYSMLAAIRWVANERLREDGIVDCFSVERVFSRLRWPEVRKYKDLLDTAIFVDYLVRRSDSPDFQAYRRFCYQAIISLLGVSKPSELFGKIDGCEQPERLLAFLESVCVPSAMDMSTFLKTSKEVFEERLAVCKGLVELSAKFEYLSGEIEEIESSRTLQEVSLYIDANRVYVDSEGIIRWLERDLSEEFFRYLQLVDSGVGVSPTFDELLKEIRDETTPLNVPDSEADVLLYGIIDRVKQKFLFDSSFGLDGFLSKRIRHNSLHGFLRNVLEEQNLVTEKESEHGEYKRSEHWAEKLAGALPRERAEIEEALIKFSSDFDTLMSDFVSQSMHVKSEDCPRGMIDLTISGFHFHYIRTVAQEERNLSGLANACFTMFWVDLERSLSDVRRHISENIERNIDSYIAQLKARICKVGDGSERLRKDEGYVELARAVGIAEARLEEAFGKVINWFSQSKAAITKQHQSLVDVINSAIRFALNSHKTFSPKITKDFSLRGKIAASNLLRVSDIFKEAIDNIFYSSGIKKDGSVWIKVHVNQEGTALDISIRNSLSSKKVKSFSHEKLVDIRKKIDRGEAGKFVRREGRSGILKMAVDVMASDGGDITFGLDGENNFYVNMRLPIEGGVVDEVAEHEESIAG